MLLTPNNYNIIKNLHCKNRKRISSRSPAKAAAQGGSQAGSPRSVANKDKCGRIFFRFRGWHTGFVKHRPHSKVTVIGSGRRWIERFVVKRNMSSGQLVLWIWSFLCLPYWNHVEIDLNKIIINLCINHRFLILISSFDKFWFCLLWSFSSFVRAQ